MKISEAQKKKFSQVHTFAKQTTPAPFSTIFLSHTIPGLKSTIEKIGIVKKQYMTQAC
jgi:hypothetical protein